MQNVLSYRTQLALRDAARSAGKQRRRDCDVLPTGCCYEAAAATEISLHST